MTEKDFLTSAQIIVSETLTILGIPGGTTLGKALEGCAERRRNEARDILIDEIQNGIHGKVEFLPEDADDFIRIIHRYSKAVEEGAARENLKLLAQVIAGKKKNKALDPDGFLKWANILSDLTRSELLLLGKSITVHHKKPDEFWPKVKAEMATGGFSAEECYALASSVARTGLLLPFSAYGELEYRSSPWLAELEQLVDLEVLLKTD